MIKRIALGCAFSCATLVASATAADFAYDDYMPSTMKDVFAIGENECGPLEENTLGLVAGKQAFRVPAVWNGEARPISGGTAAILVMHERVRTPAFAVSMSDLFKTEVHVTADGRDFWLPIQEQILAAFKTEVGPVKDVTLYVMYFGCTAKKPVRVAVVINEFQAGKN